MHRSTKSFPDMNRYPLTPQNRIRSRSPGPGYSGYSPESDFQNYSNTPSQRSGHYFQSPPPTHQTSRQSSGTYIQTPRSRKEQTSPYSNWSQAETQTFTPPNVETHQPPRSVSTFLPIRERTRKILIQNRNFIYLFQNTMRRILTLASYLLIVVL